MSVYKITPTEEGIITVTVSYDDNVALGLDKTETIHVTAQGG